MDASQSERYELQVGQEWRFELEEDEAVAIQVSGSRSRGRGRGGQFRKWMGIDARDTINVGSYW